MVFRGRKPVRAGDILRKLANRGGLLRAGRLHRVSRAMHEALEELRLDGAELCFLLHLHRGVMTVGVESAVTRHEMQCFHRQELLARMQDKLPREKIQEIRFIVSERNDGLSQDEQR